MLAFEVSGSQTKSHVSVSHKEKLDQETESKTNTLKTKRQPEPRYGDDGEVATSQGTPGAIRTWLEQGRGSPPRAFQWGRALPIL